MNEKDALETVARVLTENEKIHFIESQTQKTYVNDRATHQAPALDENGLHQEYRHAFYTKYNREPPRGKTVKEGYPEAIENFTENAVSDAANYVFIDYEEVAGSYIWLMGSPYRMVTPEDGDLLSELYATTVVPDKISEAVDTLDLPFDPATALADFIEKDAEAAAAALEDGDPRVVTRVASSHLDFINEYFPGHYKELRRHDLADSIGEGDQP